MEKNNTPFGDIQYVGDLLSKSYPTTIIYKNDVTCKFEKIVSSCA